MAGTGAVDLQVAYGALRVDGGKPASSSEGGSAENMVVQRNAAQRSAACRDSGLVGLWPQSLRRGRGMYAYGKFPGAENQLRGSSTEGGRLNRPTFDEASVSEFNVELLPALGFPTRPINGSRGMSKGGGRCLW